MLFLDEIGELGLDERAKILRAIEEKRFLPIGSDQEVTSDFQLIAGTNRDLVQAVAAGGFREDLFPRLNLWTFTLPGLAHRREDIAPNLDYELDRYAKHEGDRVTFHNVARKRDLAYCRIGGSTVARQLPRSCHECHPDGDVQSQGPDRRRLRGSGDSAAAAAVERRRKR